MQNAKIKLRSWFCRSMPMVSMERLLPSRSQLFSMADVHSHWFCQLANRHYGLMTTKILLRISSFQQTALRGGFFSVFDQIESPSKIEPKPTKMPTKQTILGNIYVMEDICLLQSTYKLKQNFKKFSAKSSISKIGATNRLIKNSKQ